MLMFDYNKYYSSRFVGVSNECDPNSYPEESRISPLDVDAVDVMFPVNPETGNVVDLLTRLMHTENQLERSQILNLLNDNGSSSPFAKLDDVTKLSLLKPRSLQSLDEIASFRDVCAKAIEEFSHKDDPAGADPAGADPAGADPAGADPAGADPAGAAS